MDKVTIDIAGRKLEVKAYYVEGGLAITRRIGWDDKPTQWYTVTHIRTGLKLNAYQFTLPEAKKFIGKVLAIRKDWSRITLRTRGLKKLGAQVRQAAIEMG